MISLSCNGISKAYIVDNIIEDVSFTLNDTEKVGLVGLNGAGKTTLFKILSEQIEQDSGTIFRAKGKKVGYLKQNTHIDSSLSIMDEMLSIFDDIITIEKQLRSLEHNISQFSEDDDEEVFLKAMDSYARLNEKFEDLNGYGYKSLIKGVLKGLGFSEKDFDSPINTLSGGQKSRVMLAALLLEQADILLLDEPTNHLDIQAITWLEKYIKDFKGCAIIISHDRYFLDNTVNKIFLMENKSLKSYNGNYSEFMKKRKIEIQQEMKKYENYEKEIEKQEELISRLHAYGSKRNIRQAMSRQKALDKIKKVEKPDSFSEKVKLKFDTKIKSGQTVLNLKALSFNYDKKNIFENLSSVIYRQDRIGIIGPNGIGKSTLLKIISKKLENYSGNVEIGHNVHIGYYDQEQTNLDYENTVIDEIWDENPMLNYYDIRTMLAHFLFKGDDLFKIVKDLSGGEKSRLSLLKLMTSNANFLIMDEPTNHLDIDSKEVLEDALLSYSGTVLVVSHDRYFLNKVTTKIFDMSESGIFEYLGNYDYYVAKNAELNEEEESSLAEKTKTKIALEKKKERELIRDRQKREKDIKNIEKEIELVESQISDIELQLCDSSIYSNSNEVIKLNELLSLSKNNLEQLYSQWTELNEI